ncbi:glycosyltransferase family A protein [Loktanella sp. S4079]|uniref:glycosyltransferase family A protein n=1 Tax=Loktanella sp. S4079 TaxID=579483 RepID=UPI0005F9FEC1|nr:glycosyltransferase family A protein [Loktanella sp. S4079]KJZ18298.1 hypothetical protein TW80_15325 [Loktanella sp. S4079]
MSLVVSLSTIPPRFDTIDSILSCLQKQTVKVDEIRVYIPKKYRRFPDYDGSLPDVPAGVRIVQPEDDLGPASKVLFAAEELRGTDTDIIFCDDDRVYTPDWFERILAARVGNEGKCIATATLDEALHLRGLSDIGETTPNPRPKLFKKGLSYRAKRIGQISRELRTGVKERKPFRPKYVKPGNACIAEGFGAVLVKPDFFDDLAYDIPDVLWSVDDVWLSGHMARKGIPIWQAAGFMHPEINKNSEKMPLYQAVLDGANRDEANVSCIKYMQDTYGVWL